MSSAVASGGVLGVHAMKQRWALETRRDGLVRSSAAWFLVDAATTDDELVSTLAAAVHLGLGTATCERLAELSAPGGYARLFASDPLLLPVVLCFADQPTGRETTHRYRWLGPPASGRTAPYTKAERAGRTVPADAAAITLEVGLTDVVEIERSLDRRGAGPGPARLIARVEAGVPSVPPVVSKLAWFCLATAELLWAGVVDRISAVVS